MVTLTYAISWHHQVPDAVWIGDMFGANASTRAIVGDGEVTYTHSVVNTGRGGERGEHDASVKWFYVLNFGALQDVTENSSGDGGGGGRGLKDGATIRPSDIGIRTDVSGVATATASTATFANRRHAAAPTTLATASTAEQQFVAWVEHDGAGSTATVPAASDILPFSATRPIELPGPSQQNHGKKFSFWRVAPVWPCPGFVLLGELTKYISVSPTRITSVTVAGGCGAPLTYGQRRNASSWATRSEPSRHGVAGGRTADDVVQLTMVGAIGERITIAFVEGALTNDAAAAAVSSKTCVVGQTGGVVMLLPSGKCSQ